MKFLYPAHSGGLRSHVSGFVWLAFLWILISHHAFASNTGITNAPLQSQTDPAIAEIKNILALPEDKIDLALVKLQLDKLIDPTIDIEKNLKILDAMTEDVRKTFPFLATNRQKLTLLMDYLYKSGSYNNYRPFSYNLDDPLGNDLKTKLLPNYLQTRKGNCVTMPSLMVILGTRLGINVKMVRAPNHLYVHFIQDDGQPLNIERDGTISNEKYKRTYYVSDKAIAKGIYMRGMSRRETVATLTMVVAELYEQRNDFETAIDISNLVLKEDPKSALAVLTKAQMYWKIAERLLKRYNYTLVGAQNQHYEKLMTLNKYWFSYAESLGWVLPPPGYDESFLQSAKKDAADNKNSGGRKNAH
jgi:regulator of sirC expression with transglutaminase-like and TPR domain